MNTDKNLKDDSGQLINKITNIIQKYKLTPEEIFKLCKSISEEKLEPGNELYDFYHNENNLKVWEQNAGSETNK
jgi:DNA-binding protein H-NS